MATPRPNANPLAGITRSIQALTGPWTRANGVSWLKLIVFILVLRWAFLELYSIPSGSMEPTLKGDPRYFRGDRVAVNKALFGPRIPFTTIRIFPLGEPKRWDIVVFNAVDPNAEHPILIKRVVGLPGEKVLIKGGRVYADGEPLEPPEHLRDVLYFTTTVAPPQTIVRDALLQLASNYTGNARMDMDVYGVEYLAEDLAKLNQRLQGRDLDALSSDQRDTMVQDLHPVSFQIVGEVLAKDLRLPTRFTYGVRNEERYTQIPESHYFLLGDNSGNSGDGRGFGWVPHKNLYGRAFAVVLPFSHRTDLTGFTKTWWGMVLLYGLPALLVLYEFTRACIGLSWRVRTANNAFGLQHGDHVWINRLALGFRIPFTRGRYLFRRQPREGDLMAFLAHDEQSNLTNLYFGALLRAKGDRYTIDCGDAKRDAAPHELLGRVQSIWWPIRRRKRLTRDSVENSVTA